MIARLCRPALRSLPRHRRQLPSSPAALVPSASSVGPPRTQPTTISRGYLGGAGEMKSRREIDPAVAAKEQELWDRARPKCDAIMERHVRLPTLEVDESAVDEDARRKRLIYRSKQRGWLEVDLLLGTWASRNVPSLSADELDEFERFVNLETIDIYNVITLRTDVPDDMKGEEGGEKTLVQKIQEWARESPLGKASREKYAEVKTGNNLI